MRQSHRPSGLAMECPSGQSIIMWSVKCSWFVVLLLLVCPGLWGSDRPGSGPSKSGTYADQPKKISDLLDKILSAAEAKNDFKNWPPNYDFDKATNVEVQLYIDTIDSVNEATMDFTVSLLLHLRWRDERLLHHNTKKDFETTKKSFLEFDSQNIKRIWVPDLFFPNEKSATFHEVMITNQMSRLYPDASILYISRLSMTLSCPMNLRYYPFDKQSCSIQIMSFGYSDDKLTLEWMNNTEPNEPTSLNMNPVIMNENVELPQFEVVNSDAIRCYKRYHQKSGNHSCIEAVFFLERNITYYVVQMYIPSILIVMLSWISFWLTVNSVPGRISLGVLTVLTMTTQSSSVNASLPRVSYTKAIDVWMSTCLVFVFCALLEFAIVNVLSRKDSLRDFSIRRVFSIPKEFDNGNRDVAVTIPLDDPDEKKKRRRFAKRGIVYAMYLDVASRIMFPLIFIFFIMIYWIYYVNVEVSE
ncbi:glycine receptor subunit alpha-4-like [Littorina saxatilis]|uniref:glycine receptor subunit alpha-4-like n=1 Tax=Littorina saxatilis TaxID=31220 RepID=UPI0038B511A0